MVKKLLKKLFNRTGIHIVKRSKYKGSSKFVIEDYSYDVVIPSANYAPWEADKVFNQTFKEIRSNTLVDIFRCYELWELTESIYNLDKNAHFIEVGVWRGGTAAIIGKKLSQLNSTVDFYIADTFTGVKKSGKNDAFYFDNEHADTSLSMVKNFIHQKYENYKILHGIFPDDTSHLVNEQIKFGFCHIDVDVYNSAKEIVEWIWNKLIVGGVIVFDDYGFHSCNGVTKYVNENKNKLDRVIVHNLNGHALMFKLK